MVEKYTEGQICFGYKVPEGFVFLYHPDDMYLDVSYKNDKSWAGTYNPTYWAIDYLVNVCLERANR